jgi:hypothetical protein
VVLGSESLARIQVSSANVAMRVFGWVGMSDNNIHCIELDPGHYPEEPRLQQGRKRRALRIDVPWGTYPQGRT